MENTGLQAPDRGGTQAATIQLWSYVTATIHSNCLTSCPSKSRMLYVMSSADRVDLMSMTKETISIHQSFSVKD